MIKGIELKLSNGNFVVTEGEGFSAIDEKMPFLSYYENGIFHVECTPDGGGLYNSTIILPRSCRPEHIKIKLKCASLTMCSVSCGSFDGEFSEASVELDAIRARRIKLYMGRCDAMIKAAPLVAAELNCGYGRMNVQLLPNKRGYYYSSFCGAGELILNSRTLKREFNGGVKGGVPIKISCGLGKLTVNER